MTDDLFSQEWAAIPVANPLPRVDATEFILSALGAPPSALGAPSSALGAPQPEPQPPLTFIDRDSKHLAFVAQARYYGHDDHALEATSQDDAGRRFFDLEAVTRFAMELLGLPHNGETDLTREQWREATHQARSQGWKAGRR